MSCFMMETHMNVTLNSLIKFSDFLGEFSQKFQWYKFCQIIVSADEVAAALEYFFQQENNEEMMLK